MKLFVGFFAMITCLSRIGCAPVLPDPAKQSTHPPVEEGNDQAPDDPILNLEYHRYLKEVVNLLESDSKFKELIEKATPEDIKSGKIATQLQFVEHNVRSKLDELKRKEIDRMRELIGRKAKLRNIRPHEIHTLLPKHIDHNNVETFEEKDLEALIKSASDDLEEHDRLRRAEFKQHEIEKEYDRRKHLEELSEEDRKKAEEEHQKNREAMKHHEKVNHPGSKDQLEEVWNEEDHLEGNEFNPKTFFALHDTDSNGFLDEFEIEALFESEVSKIFNTSNPEYDERERDEEMARMREHVFTEMDKNRDKMISLDEFIAETQEKDFDNEDEWKSVEDERLFDEEELEEYRRAHDPDHLDNYVPQKEAVDSQKNKKQIPQNKIPPTHS